MDAEGSSSPPAARAEAKVGRIAPDHTFVEVAELRLHELLQGAGFSYAEERSAIAAVRSVLEPWGCERVGRAPSMPCDIGDDAFPLEFSISLAPNGRCDVRVLFEARGSLCDMSSRWKAGLALNRLLEQRHGASSDRLRIVEDLFVPVAPRAHFAMWHSIAFRRGADPQLKIYLNPQARGKEGAAHVASEMLRRLGFAHVAPALTRYERPEDEIKFVSLDLGRSDDARVKVYKVHPGASRRDIERELSAVPDTPRDAVARFFEQFVGSDGPFLGLPISTYIAVASGRDAPTGGTVHFPIRDYVTDDGVVHDRLCRLFSSEARTVYERAVHAFAKRALPSGVGMHSYVSLGIERGSSRITVYLSPEGYRVDPPRARTR